MTPFQEAMHAFVQKHERWTRINGNPSAGHAVEAQAERDLAEAGDRLETVLRQMMRDEAVEVSVNLRNEAEP